MRQNCICGGGEGASSTAQPACLFNPLDWQLLAANEPAELHRLRELEAIREYFLSDESVGIHVSSNALELQRELAEFGCVGYGRGGDLCNLLTDNSTNLESMAQRLHMYHNPRGMKRLLIFKTSTIPSGPSWRQQCVNDACGHGYGAIGNNLGSYAIARAAAIAGNLDFIDVRPLCSSNKTVDIAALLPAVAAAPAPHLSGNFSKTTAVACFGVNRRDFAPDTRSLQWDAYMPVFRKELTAALKDWSRCTGFPQPDRPIDDIAIAVRCGDAFFQRKRDYGLMRVTDLARLIPDESGITVGIVTQPHAAGCSAQRKIKSDTDTASGQAHGNRTDGRGEYAGMFAHVPGPKGAMHGVWDCPCQCQALVEEIAHGLRILRPRALVSIRDGDTVVGSLARLALAKTATVCISSTFCMWPTMASTTGYIAEIGTFGAAKRIAGHVLPSLTYLHSRTVVPFSSSFGSCARGALSHSAADPVRKWARSMLLVGSNQTVPYDPLSLTVGPLPSTVGLLRVGSPQRVW